MLRNFELAGFKIRSQRLFLKHVIDMNLDSELETPEIKEDIALQEELVNVIIMIQDCQLDLWNKQEENIYSAFNKLEKNEISKYKMQNILTFNLKPRVSKIINQHLKKDTRLFHNLKILVIEHLYNLEVQESEYFQEVTSQCLNIANKIYEGNINLAEIFKERAGNLINALKYQDMDIVKFLSLWVDKFLNSGPSFQY